MALDDFFDETVLVNAVREWRNVRGVRTPDYAPTVVRCNLQPMSASRLSMHGAEASRTGWTAWASAWPEGLAVGATVKWPSKGKTLQVLAPPRDEGGAGQVYGLDLLELV